MYGLHSQLKLSDEQQRQLSEIGEAATRDYVQLKILRQMVVAASNTAYACSSSVDKHMHSLLTSEDFFEEDQRNKFLHWSVKQASKICKANISETDVVLGKIPDWRRTQS